MANTYPAPCLLGHRLNAFRLNRTDGRVYVAIGGTWTTSGQDCLVNSLTIHDQLNETPNTLIATVRGARPVEGNTILVAVGSKNADRLFFGYMLRVTRVWAADPSPTTMLYHVEATDPTWVLNSILFSARYQNTSAAAIAADLITKAPAGFTLAPVEPALSGIFVDEISFTNTTVMDAFVQLAGRIGGYAFCDYYSVVHLFVTASISQPQPIATGHKSLANMSFVTDLTQIVTRAVVEGGGGNALANVAPGSPVLPVDVIGWYLAAGGYVRSGPQRIKYTGVTPGGAGAFVGSGVAPTTAPSATTGMGASALVNGWHNYAYTWVTANGETLPSPLLGVLTGVANLTPPPTVPWASNQVNWVGSGLVIGTSYSYALAWNFSTDSKNTAALSPLGTRASQVCQSYWTGTLNPPNTYQPCGFSIGWNGNPTPPTGAQLLQVYRLVNGSWYLVAAWTVSGGNVVYQTAYDANSDAQLIGQGGVHPDPTNGTQVSAQVTLAGIATGPSGVTARRVYRAPVNVTSPLKLLATIADNTTTAMASYDNTPDASLGANAPSADTAGLIQQSKQILAGATAILVTSAAPFAAGGGYAQVGNQVIRYGGITGGNTLTGIPTQGDGAITQSIAWGTAITTAAALLGVTGILYPILRGDAVNLVVLVDDLVAQQALAALVGGSGVREALLQDGRISADEAAARASAELAAYKNPIQTFSHRSRDPATRSGNLLTVNLPAPTNVAGQWRIQDVTITVFNPRGLVQPTYDARSSSQLFTFDDLLRMVHGDALPPTGETI
jgi:hypothetical protein